MSIINQKEYLKKYLSLGDEKEKNKKRKKKAKIIKDRVKIIDDDIDVPYNIKESELNEFLTAEDAPQVVGIVDDRPLSMRIDDYRKSDKWKLVGSDDELKEPENKETKYKRNNTKTDSDLSSRKSNKSDSDYSPPRKSKNPSTLQEKKVIRKKSRFTDATPPKKNENLNYDSDISLPRKTKSDSDTSPPRKQKFFDSDVSPPRKQKNSDSDASPPRRQKRRQTSSNNTSPRRRHRKQSDSDTSPPRRRKSRFNQNSDKKSDKTSKKMTKTLDGKIAGLQSGHDLKQETAALKKREDELFKNMSEEVSGRNAAPIMRDRKTGKRRDLEQETQEEFKKQQIENARKEKYDKWGKGLKQVEDTKQKIEEELYEMSKPLARYADDEDLEKLLKDREREGDPMLQYLRKKKKKDAIVAGKPIDLKPKYEGEFMPNRFGIPPGHRWDGVDRSNGYEKEWFTVQNSKKAVQEEIYKWSTEDM